MAGLILPPAPWREREGLATLVAALGGGDDARFVGGAVRDTLLGLDVADIDVATRHAPQIVVERLTHAGVRTVPTGIAHGTVTAILPGGPVEVTTLRRDVATDGRHAVVAYTDDWQEDAARRDFTLNALYADPGTGQLFDWFDGIADLMAGRIRFIGDPYRRIAEDHLRILRFFRFLARFGDRPDEAALDACTARANDLMALSRERIADELLKLLVARDAVRVVGVMIDRGILLPVLPEIHRAGAARLARTAIREAAAELAPDPIRRLAALLPPDRSVAEAVAARLKLSKARRRQLESATEPASADARALAYRIGPAGAMDRLLLDEADRTADIADLTAWTPPRLPLSGGALVARGITAGPDVARRLRAIEDQWVAEGFPDADRLTVILDDQLRDADNSV